MATLDLTLSAVIRSAFLHQRKATEQPQTPLLLLKRAYSYTDLNVLSLLFDVNKHLIVFFVFMCFAVPGIYLKLKLF